MEPQSLDEVRPGCYDVHERVKDMDAGGVLASMNFPSFPTFTARASSRPTTSTCRSRSCGPTTTGTSTSGAAPTPAASSRWRVPVIWDAEETAAEVRRCAAKGCHSLSFTENPAALGYPSFHDDVLGPAVEGVRRHRHGAVDPPRLVGQAVDPRRRLAARRDDHAAADEHPVRRRRPAVVAGHQGRSPTSASRCPRAAPAGSRTSSTASTAPTRCTAPGRSRTSAAGCPSEVFREHFLTCFISDPIGVELRHQIGVDNMCWEADYPHSDSMWPDRPRGARRGVRGQRRARRRDPQDDPRERHALVLVRPLRAHAEGGGHRRRAAAPGGRPRRVDRCRAAPGCAPPTRSSRASASAPSAPSPPPGEHPPHHHPDLGHHRRRDRWRPASMPSTTTPSRRSAAAWLDHKVVFFRDQELDGDQFLAFARRSVSWRATRSCPASTATPTSSPSPSCPHETRATSAASGTPTPRTSTSRRWPRCSWPVRSRPPGGDTLFADMYAAYDDALARHAGAARAAAGGQQLGPGRREQDARGPHPRRRRRRRPPEFEAVHPVVRTHPETGRRALYVNIAHTARFDGMTEEESRPLLQFLFQHQVRPELTCRFRWRSARSPCGTTAAPSTTP